MSDKPKADLSAFPYSPAATGRARGMSLRDFFAAAALQGFISYGDRWGCYNEIAKDIKDYEAKKTTAIDLAESAYQFADALLAEREKES